MTAADAPAKHYLALCGGVGGAKLALGLSRLLPPGALTIAVNNGDDFEHLGLTICPDLDTVTYTLGGIVHPAQGWGRDAETWGALAELERLGGETWFRLGDKDLGLHLARRALLDSGLSLSAVTARLAHGFGIAHGITPMSDVAVRTMVDTDAGLLPFQHYFVRERCAPVVRGIQYFGAAFAQPAPALLEALANPTLAGVIVCPSNPYLSIDPILALAGIRDALRASRAPVIAVAPIVGGAAIKGPTAKIMRELAVEPSAAAVGRHYGDLLDGYIVDAADAAAAADAVALAGVEVMACNIVMKSLADKLALAQRCLAFADSLAGRA